MKTKDFALDIKAVSDDGLFSGYGSVFGVVDSSGELVEPGAFAASLGRHQREGTKPLMLWQHDPYQPIGVWEQVVEDGKGLWVEGRIVKGVRAAEEAHLLLKAGAIRGLSIGYYEQEAEPDTAREIRRLKKLDLVEVSVVSFPANRRARVDVVKSERLGQWAKRLRDGDPAPPKEFEDILRDAGVPKSMACKIASIGYANAIRRDSEGGEARDAAKAALSEMRQMLRGFTLPSLGD